MNVPLFAEDEELNWRDDPYAWHLRAWPGCYLNGRSAH